MTIKEFSMEIPQFDRGSSVIAMENTPITFTWKELTIKIKGTEARNGFLGMGKRNATNEKRILDKGKYPLQKKRMYLGSWCTQCCTKLDHFQEKEHDA